MIDYPYYPSVIDVVDCAACGNFHDDIEAGEIDPPVQMNDGKTYRYWFICPMTGETVFIEETDEQAK